eukprot:TRINITY_DN12836_c2_g1_i2.p1 TRINITY_DN12836_c2_g1~~TRINITY_DN12836_c2_g1_i2.p1  ORF type:complete len:223 (-),score=-10.24 TRINITY_DN12836_c2_g1_i2:13-681(-)
MESRDWSSDVCSSDLSKPNYKTIQNIKPKIANTVRIQLKPNSSSKLLNKQLELKKITNCYKKDLKIVFFNISQVVISTMIYMARSKTNAILYEIHKNGQKIHLIIYSTRPIYFQDVYTSYFTISVNNTTFPHSNLLIQWVQLEYTFCSTPHIVIQSQTKLAAPYDVILYFNTQSQHTKEKKRDPAKIIIIQNHYKQSTILRPTPYKKDIRKQKERNKPNKKK